MRTASGVGVYWFDVVNEWTSPSGRSKLMKSKTGTFIEECSTIPGTYKEGQGTITIFGPIDEASTRPIIKDRTYQEALAWFRSNGVEIPPELSCEHLRDAIQDVLFFCNRPDRSEFRRAASDLRRATHDAYHKLPEVVSADVAKHIEAVLWELESAMNSEDDDRMGANLRRLMEWQEWLRLEVRYKTAPMVVSNYARNAAAAATEADRAKESVEELAPLSVDLRDYVSATDIISRHSPPGVVLNHKRLKRFLDLHSSIRTTRPLAKDGKPRWNRLLINLADWHKNRESLLEWDSADRDPIDKATDDEVAERLEVVKRQKEQRK